MHKTLITLTEPQLHFLRTQADQLDINVSELVRRIIDKERHMQPQGQNATKIAQHLKKHFGERLGPLRITVEPGRPGEASELNHQYDIKDSLTRDDYTAIANINNDCDTDITINDWETMDTVDTTGHTPPAATLVY